MGHTGYRNLDQGIASVFEERYCYLDTKVFPLTHSSYVQHAIVLDKLTM
jgi:hypothetical protein